MADTPKLVYKIQGMGEFGEKWDFYETWDEAEAAISQHTRQYPDKPLSLIQVPYADKHKRPQPNRTMRAQLYLLINLIKAKAAYPDLRTGQIIGNSTGRDIYHMEDLDLADAIHDWMEKTKNEQKP